jgi:acyl carrier protein
MIPEILATTILSRLAKEPEMIGRLLEKLGSMPNIPSKTMGGRVFWTDIVNVQGWRLQKNSIFGNCRILDPNNIRRAWGGETSMMRAFKALEYYCIDQCKDNNVEQKKSLEELGINGNKKEIFMNIRDLIINKLNINVNQIFWDSHLEADLNLDWIDVIEISMDLEEIYDIEIPDDILGDEQHLPYDNQQKTNKFLSLSSSCSGYDSYKITCTVGNLAVFIDEQLSQSKIVSTSV